MKAKCVCGLELVEHPKCNGAWGCPVHNLDIAKYYPATPKTASNCCMSAMVVVHGGEGTNYYKCVKCQRACDPKPASPCEHNAGTFWRKFDGASIFSQELKCDYPICPYCKPAQKPVSSCCGAELEVMTDTDLGSQGTSYYICRECRLPCDPKAETQAAITEKDLFEYLSLVGLRDFQEVASACFNWCRINFTPRKMESQARRKAMIKRHCEHNPETLCQFCIERLEKALAEANKENERLNQVLTLASEHKRNANALDKSMFDALEKERDGLLALIEDWKIEEEAWKETEAKLTRSNDAMRKYATHFYWCSYIVNLGVIGKFECDCGFLAAIQKESQ